MKTKSQYFKEFIGLSLIWNVTPMLPTYIVIRRLFEGETTLQIISMITLWFLFSCLTINSWHTEERIEKLEKEIKELKQQDKPSIA